MLTFVVVGSAGTAPAQERCRSHDLGRLFAAHFAERPFLRAEMDRLYPDPQIPPAEVRTLVQRGGGRNYLLLIDDDGAIENGDWYRDSDRLWHSLLHGYYRPDAADVQFLAFFTAFPIDFKGAFYAPVANDVLGIGASDPKGDGETFDNSPDSNLEGLLVLNDYAIYMRDPRQIALTFNQELGHRWGAFVRFDDGSGPSSALLGRAEAHWSFFLDSNASPMEGNRWIAGPGDGYFHSITDQLTPAFNDFDLYLMGLLPIDQVRPITLLTDVDVMGALDANGQTISAASPPAIDASVVVRGQAKTVAIDEVVAVHGARLPPAAQAPRTFSIAFVLVVRPDQARDAAIDKDFSDLVDRTVATWEAATGDRARLDVQSSGSPLLPGVGMGEPCPSGIVDCDPAVATACAAPKSPAGQSTPICTIRCADDSLCPEGYCCQPSSGGGSYCLPAVDGGSCKSDGEVDGGASEAPAHDGGTPPIVHKKPAPRSGGGCGAVPGATPATVPLAAAGLLLAALLLALIRP